MVVGGWWRVVELNQKVKITVLRVKIGANRRAEDVQPARTRAATQIGDLISFLIQKGVRAGSSGNYARKG